MHAPLPNDDLLSCGAVLTSFFHHLVGSLFAAGTCMQRRLSNSHGAQGGGHRDGCGIGEDVGTPQPGYPAGCAQLHMVGHDKFEHHTLACTRPL